MCFGSSTKEDPNAKKSREIEKQLRDDQKRLQKEVKLLLLGMSLTPYHLYASSPAYCLSTYTSTTPSAPKLTFLLTHRSW